MKKLTILLLCLALSGNGCTIYIAGTHNYHPLLKETTHENSASISAQEILRSTPDKEETSDSPDGDRTDLGDLILSGSNK